MMIFILWRKRYLSYSRRINNNFTIFSLIDRKDLMADSYWFCHMGPDTLWGITIHKYSLPSIDNLISLDFLFPQGLWKSFLFFCLKICLNEIFFLSLHLILVIMSIRYWWMNSVIAHNANDSPRWAKEDSSEMIY